MTWLDAELLQRKGKRSYLTTGIALVLLAIFAIPFLLAIVHLFRGNDVPDSAPLMALIGFSPFILWFLIGAGRGFR